jgi:hypothetical protein
VTLAGFVVPCWICVRAAHSGARGSKFPKLVYIVLASGSPRLSLGGLDSDDNEDDDMETETTTTSAPSPPRKVFVLYYDVSPPIHFRQSHVPPSTTTSHPTNDDSKKYDKNVCQIPLDWALLTDYDRLPRTIARISIVQHIRCRRN